MKVEISISNAAWGYPIWKTIAYSRYTGRGTPQCASPHVWQAYLKGIISIWIPTHCTHRATPQFVFSDGLWENKALGKISQNNHMYKSGASDCESFSGKDGSGSWGLNCLEDPVPGQKQKLKHFLEVVLRDKGQGEWSEDFPPLKEITWEWRTLLLGAVLWPLQTFWPWEDTSWP